MAFIKKYDVFEYGDGIRMTEEEYKKTIEYEENHSLLVKSCKEDKNKQFKEIDDWRKQVLEMRKKINEKRRKNK